MRWGRGQGLGVLGVARGCSVGRWQGVVGVRWQGVVMEEVTRGCSVGRWQGVVGGDGKGL